MSELHQSNVRRPGLWAWIVGVVGGRQFTGAGFLASVILGWGIELLYGVSAGDTAWIGIRTFCLLWFASGAAFFTGTIAGFLFSVPKIATGTAGTVLTAGQAQSASRYRINTNLEEISDWFTKIILGLGLVHIGKVITFIDDIGGSAANAIGQLQGAKVMVISSMIYGFVCGFLIVYIWTRTKLTSEFEKAEA